MSHTLFDIPVVIDCGNRAVSLDELRQALYASARGRVGEVRLRAGNTYVVVLSDESDVDWLTDVLNAWFERQFGDRISVEMVRP